MDKFKRNKTNITSRVQYMVSLARGENVKKQDENCDVPEKKTYKEVVTDLKWEMEEAVRVILEDNVSSKLVNDVTGISTLITNDLAAPHIAENLQEPEGCVMFNEEVVDSEAVLSEADGHQQPLENMDEDSEAVLSEASGHLQPLENMYEDSEAVLSEAGGHLPLENMDEHSEAVLPEAGGHLQPLENMDEDSEAVLFEAGGHLQPLENMDEHSEAVLPEADGHLQPLENMDEQDWNPDDIQQESMDQEVNQDVKETLNEERNGKKGRKRKPDMNTWNRKENQFKREKGYEFKGLSKNEKGKWMPNKDREARKMKGRCNCKQSERNTKIKCGTFTEEDRQSIFNIFWGNMNWSQRKVYVASLVDVVLPKDLKNQVNEVSRRSNTLICYLKKHGIRVRVCKEMLMNTLCIGSWSLQNWAKSSRKDEVLVKDKIEKRKSLRLENEKKAQKDFFNQLPKMESHYCRASSFKLYLEPIWTSKNSLYQEYVQTCKIKKITPLSIKTFHDEFNDNNLSLFRPKKDQCDLCVSYKAGNSSEIKYNEHIARKNEARKEKEQDKEFSQHVFTMDLQSTLLCPMLKASAIYYKKKLIVHNFTLFNCNTKDGYCFLWHEAEGGVTANEFASILYHFIDEKASLTAGDEIILYSDGCSYQNRNAILSNALLHLSKEKNLIITQKYLVSGHTQMECDSMHSTIERKIKNKDIYSPAGYLSASKSARVNPKPYEVEYLRHTFFKDFSKLKYYTSIRPGFKAGDPTVNNLCAIQYQPDGKIRFKLRFSDDWKILERRQRRKSKETGNIEQLYKKQLPIKKSKYDHLQQLKYVIPADFHLFYDNLPSEAD